ncbi:MAG TPA: MFS transporter [Stellaceae bacterium]|nr:MFS transporter [Stellaceae bacterium]
MDSNTTIASLPWYRSLNREQWGVLIASNLGWLFDGFEIFALFLTVGFALRQLLDAAQYADIPQYAGFVLATTVFGWATGGVIGGVVADYIGRKRTMILAILAYSLTTGLSAFAWDWVSFAALRFLVGVAIGSEWATGASIVSELWPDHARGKGGGLLQCGAGLGGILASLVWLAIGGSGPNAWRWMYLIGVLPAFVTLWIRRGIPESRRWEEASERRRAAHALRRSGATLDREDRAFTRFTVVDLFADRAVRRPLIGAFLMMLSVTFAYWGVGTFIPTYVGSVAAKNGFSAPYWSAWAGLITSVCGVAGFISLGFLADALGRKPAAMLFYLMCLILTPVVYLWAQDFTVLLFCVGVFGFFTLGIWAWAPIWLPELFPTRMRATAVAFCFNAPRFISCVGPLIAGTLIVALGGYGPAATIVGLFFILGLVAAPFLPETNGKPLPETLSPAAPQVALTS